jgi:hypothetical protein
LKQDKDEALEQLRVAWYCVTTYENEKEEFSGDDLGGQSEATERKGAVSHRTGHSQRGSE